MKIFKHSQFARQLIVYLAIVLLLVLFFISVALVTSVHQFIGNNTYQQSEIFAKNICTSLKRTITLIEQIPNHPINSRKFTNSAKSKLLPHKILNSHSQLIEVSIHYKRTNSDTSHFIHTIATRHDNGQIITTTKNRYSLHESICQKLDKGNNRKGIWIYSEVNQKSILSYCHPLQNLPNQYERYLKLDFHLERMIALSCDYKLYQNGYLFIIDSSANCISHSFNTIQDTSSNSKTHYKHISQYLKNKIAKGETGCSIYENNGSSYFLHYSPIPFMNWHLGIVSPYDISLNSSIKLHGTSLIYLAGAFLFVFVCILYVVHLQSLPLKQLTSCVRKIVDEQFNVDIPHIKSTKEITELYASFRYMQYNISEHIKKLKISTAEQERVNTEMLTAQRIQQSFLSKPIELPNNLELAAKLQQSRKVGGDSFQFSISKNQLHFAIGDVSGKGVPAAIYMSSVAKLFQYIAQEEQSTAIICNILNKQMCVDNEADMYITMFIGILDIDTGRLIYTNAGHTYPLVVHENGSTDSMAEYPDVPIGVIEGHTFTEHTYTLKHNSSILLYTDGITDAENCAGQFYGADKLVKCVEEIANKSPKQIIEAVIKDIEKHIETRQQSDDLTLLMLRHRRKTSIQNLIDIKNTEKL